MAVYGEARLGQTVGSGGLTVCVAPTDIQEESKCNEFLFQSLLPDQEGLEIHQALPDHLRTRFGGDGG